MKLAYMAHPLGPDGPEREKNRQNATKWFGWLHDQFPSLAFTANWIVLSGAWPETEEHRKRGLEIDMVHVERSDLIFYVGGRFSAGMIEEQKRAASRGLHQVDLTFLGHGPPARQVLPGNIVSNMIQGIEAGYFRELDKSLARMGRTPSEAVAEGFARGYAEQDACLTTRVCTHRDPCSWCRENGIVCTAENPCEWCLNNPEAYPLGSGLDPGRPKGEAG